MTRKLIISILLAGMCVLLYNPLGKVDDRVISGDGFSNVLSDGMWQYENHAAYSENAIAISLRYDHKYTVQLLLGVQYASSYFSPGTWRQFPGIIPDISFRELVTVGDTLYKWQVLLSKPDTHQQRNLVAYSYLMGLKSAFTFNGAGIWRFAYSSLGTGTFPYIILKIYIPDQKEAAVAQAILDSFRKEIVPKLHCVLMDTFGPRYLCFKYGKAVFSTVE